MSSLSRLLVALAAWIVCAAAAHAQAPKVRFSLDWVVQGQHAPFLLAKGKGYFDQEGVDVTVDVGNGSAGTVQRLASGAYDMGFADLSTLIEFLGNNPHLPRVQAVYMVHERNPNALFALKRSGISKPADLKGKKISGPVFSSTRKTWPLFARATGLKVDDAAWQNVAPDMVEQAVVRGDVQVGSGFPTQLQIYNRLGVKTEDIVTLKYADFGVDLYGNAVLASARFLGENPQAVAAVLRAINRAMKDTIADPAAAVKFVMQRNPLLNEADELEKLKLVMEFMDTPNTRADGLGSIKKLRLDNQVDDINLAFGLKSKPSPDIIFSSAFLPRPAERRYR
ncbi:MAG: ABC transporter substrate-binding protein [Burkholderiales bacterium]|nr:ABC transporter substrate-binding protein [Burkholderiales bacterium]